MRALLGTTPRWVGSFGGFNAVGSVDLRETALSVVLLVGALLLQRTFTNLSRVNLGFRPEGAITAGLFLGQGPPESRVALLDSDPRTR